MCVYVREQTCGVRARVRVRVRAREACVPVRAHRTMRLHHACPSVQEVHTETQVTVAVAGGKDSMTLPTIN